jgi:hypothetical protein
MRIVEEFEPEELPQPENIPLRDMLEEFEEVNILGELCPPKSIGRIQSNRIVVI